MFHRLERRIRAHILLCWLALLIIPLAERQTGQTWRRIALELQRLHLVTLTGRVGSVTHTTTLANPQRQILTALRIDPLPRVTTLTPRLSTPGRPRPRGHQLRNSGFSAFRP